MKAIKASQSFASAGAKEYKSKKLTTCASVFSLYAERPCAFGVREAQRILLKKVLALF